MRRQTAHATLDFSCLPQIASSTWYNHVEKLLCLDYQDPNTPYGKFLQNLRDNSSLRKFVTTNLLKDVESSFISDKQFMTHTLNFVFVRNPFSRFSSLYFENTGRCEQRHDSFHTK